MSKIRVSRGHYGDLLAASINIENENPELKKQFDAMEFEIVDNPEPGEVLTDLSIMFMYPLKTATTIVDQVYGQQGTYKCVRCQLRLKTWQGSDAKCAFKEGHFTPDNWRCATAKLIRGIAESTVKMKPGLSNLVKYFYSTSDQNYAVINTENIPIFSKQFDNPALCLWVGWYKERGKTEGMWLMFENLPPRQPTLEECDEIIRYYQA